MKIKRIAAAVLLTMVMGARAAPRERILPVIEIRASALEMKPDAKTLGVVADSVFASVMSRLDAVGKLHTTKANGTQPAQESYAVDLQTLNLWLNPGR